MFPVHQNYQYTIDELITIRINQLPVFVTRCQFHQHIYMQLFRVNDEKAALKKPFHKTFLNKIFAGCAENLSKLF
jgi:hypothetical protein